MYNNDDWRQGRPNIPDYEKISRKSFWQRYRWIIISAINSVLVLFFASTTLYLLLNRPTAPSTAAVAPRPTSAPVATAVPTQAPTATSEASLSATPVTPTSSTNKLNLASTGYNFVCITRCDYSIDVKLQSITVDENAQELIWNFQVTDNGSCHNIQGNLSLESPEGKKIEPHSGTFTKATDLNSAPLSRSALLSPLPTHKIQYTASLAMVCNESFLPTTSTYQAVMFSY